MPGQISVGDLGQNYSGGNIITKGHEAGATRFLIINNSCSSISTTSTQ
jgi:hypothetical protein